MSAKIMISISIMKTDINILESGARKPILCFPKYMENNYYDLAYLDLCTVYYKVFAFFYNWKVETYVSPSLNLLT